MDAIIGGIMIVVGIGMGLLGFVVSLFNTSGSKISMEALIGYGLIGSGLLLIYSGTKKIR